MVGTNEQFAEMKHREKFGDGLSELDRMVIGEAVRIEIPFVDAFAMRRIADLLRGYAETIDFYSRRTDVPPRTILVHLRSEARAINARIREITGTRRRRGRNIRSAGNRGEHDA